MIIVIDGPEEHVNGSRVRPAFFGPAGRVALLGRLFTDPEYAAGGEGADVVILSHAYWAQRWRSDPAAIGRVVVVDGRRRVIVGIGPPQFEPTGSGSLWIPGAR